MPELPRKKVGIVSCSGEELAEGTVTRLAALKVLEQLCPEDTVTICLPLFLVTRLTIILILPLVLLLPASRSVALELTPAPSTPCAIEIIESGSGWPVPLVELVTTHRLKFISDNAGRIAIDAPELMGREVWFDLHGEGYEVAKDGFGYRGRRLRIEPGARHANMSGYP